MKNKTLALLIAMSSFNLIAQQSNSLPPSGNVGIGTIKPQSSLEVIGNVRISTDLKVEGKVNLLNIEDVGKLNVSDKILFIDQNGDIKRGTLNRIDAPNFNDRIICRTDANGNIPNPSWDNGLNKIFVKCPEINVGISTDAPRTKLDVIGGIHGLRLSLGNNADPTMMGSKVFYLKSVTTVPSHKNFVIENSGGTELFSIQNNGLLTINNGLPGSNNGKLLTIGNLDRKLLELNNNGLLYAREIRVNLENWPDYVFEKNYQLLNIDELEKYITEKKHLPNIPDAETIASEGLNLGEMEKLLMQKVEELTLYIIEQNKLNQQQQKTIENLSKEVQLLKSK